ncbi:hypothetical protein FHR99_003179 [Litorivivens lipolytica]|uniref:Uncharacterized protein n=1 Tax=Litorivivens lipolytica TaxID=1524264 RepID=A0A7W4Z8D5_9GAMM|nr:hypothetical protein [Litorivivens lipolytica]
MVHMQGSWMGEVVRMMDLGMVLQSVNLSVK